jgi:hypothetical protein
MSTPQDEIRTALDAVDAGYVHLRAACSELVRNGFRVEISDHLGPLSCITDKQRDIECLFVDSAPSHSVLSTGLFRASFTDRGPHAHTSGNARCEIGRAHHPDKFLRALFEDDP